MPQTAFLADMSASDLSGDVCELLDQLNSPEALPTLSLATAALSLETVSDQATLRRFLVGYRERALVPVELPVILRAHGHAVRNEWRELLALDHELARDARLREFRVASAVVGRRQLAKLRPLRDQRLVQRYLHAVEAGQANGWHTLVLGVFFALYSFPLRQGLLLYGQRTLGGFFDAAVGTLRLSAATAAPLLADAVQPLVPAVNQLLAGSLSEELSVVR